MEQLGTKLVDVFSTCPQSKDLSQSEYLDAVVRISKWSEEFGCEGMLVYTDNGIVDPWAVSQVVLQNTTSLRPLVAIQPIYMHPYWVAKNIATLAFLHGRSIFLNMLAGGFKNDLIALGDNTPHDDRYVRTVEYTNIISALCRGETVTHQGKYYNVENLKLVPAIPEELQPGILSSGSSAAGMQAARDMNSIAIKYPKPPGEEEDVRDGHAPGYGVRIGIIARDTADEAWKVALERFPEDRKGQLMHQLAMKVSDSSWHTQLSVRHDEDGNERSPYWLGPFQNYRTFCPYLVGDYGQVAELIAGYIRSGYKTFILDIPASREALTHQGIVFREAEKLVSAA